MNYQTQIDVGLDFGNIRLAIGAYEVIIPSEVARKLAQDVRDILAAVKDPAQVPMPVATPGQMPKVAFTDAQYGRFDDEPEMAGVIDSEWRDRFGV